MSSHSKNATTGNTPKHSQYYYSLDNNCSLPCWLLYLFLKIHKQVLFLGWAEEDICSSWPHNEVEPSSTPPLQVLLLFVISVAFRSHHLLHYKYPKIQFLCNRSQANMYLYIYLPVPALCLYWVIYWNWPRYKLWQLYWRQRWNMFFLLSIGKLPFWGRKQFKCRQIMGFF